MDNATRRQILERVKQLGYPNTIEALRNPQILDQYEQQLQAQSQQQQPIQQPEPVTFPTPPVTTPNYKVPQPRQSEAKPLVMSFNQTAPQLMRDGGPKDPPKKQTRTISDPEEFKIANQAYQDSLSTYNSTQNFINEINNVNNLYKKGILSDYDFSNNRTDGSTYKSFNNLDQLQANNIKTRKSNPLYNNKGEIVAKSKVSTLSKRTDEIRPSDSITLQAGPQPYLVNIYDAPKVKPVFQEAPTYIEPLPIQKLPITSQPGLVSYDLPEITDNKSTPIYQASQAHRTGQYQIGNNVWNEDKKKWERRLFKDSEERDWYFNQGKIKKYGGFKFDKGGPKDKGWKEYKTPTGQSIYLDPNFKSYARYLDSNGNVIPVTELQKFSMIYDPQANTWDSTHSEKTLNVYDRRMSFEDRLNRSLGDPMGKAAREAAEGLEPGEDPVDNFRHPLAGMYTQQAIANKTGNIPIVSPVLGWLGANAMGVGHELGTIFNDNRPLKYKGREALEDIFNNAYGATIGLLPIPNKSKEEILYKTSAKNMIPDGISDPDGRDFYFKKMGGKKCYTCNSSKMKVLYNKANYKK